MQLRLMLIPVLVMLTGCASNMPTTRPAGPRVEIRREIRDLENLHFEPGRSIDQAAGQTSLWHARVLDAYVYDVGPDEARHDVVAKAIPQVLAALETHGKDEEAVLVRIYVVTGGDLNDAWITSVSPAQLRAIGRLPEPQRAAALKGLAWGYTTRRRWP